MNGKKKKKAPSKPPLKRDLSYRSESGGKGGLSWQSTMTGSYKWAGGSAGGGGVNVLRTRSTRSYAPKRVERAAASGVCSG